MAVAQGNVTKPVAGDQWVVGEPTTIAWDPAGFSDKVDIALVPAGATDTSVVIAQIAKATANTGSQSWTPPSSMSAGDVSIVIVNSQQSSAQGLTAASSGRKHSTISETFVIIHSPKAPTTTTATVTVHPGVSTTATMTSRVTVIMNTTTIRPPLTTATGNRTSIAPAAAAPFTNATRSATRRAASGTAPSATRSGSATGTGVGATRPTFTGAAVLLKMSSVHTMIPGGMAIIMAILFF
ncbi:hypothetical protein VTL71DRAFT_14020 [Oculimacula yallundae]|uniref:Yeast cell wall synthesis Kre9/Knh1-like N-terminal domain-containing protein n=1 Tax=Oculimacula yallundae TaxID=86028 RepID=A0ABR4CMJ6_9HELO